MALCVCEYPCRTPSPRLVPPGVQACHSCLRASVNHTHILEMGKGGELHRLKLSQDQETEDASKASAEDGDGKGSLGSLFEDDPNNAAGFADQFHVAFQQQNRTLMAQLERVGVALIDLSIQDWYECRGWNALLGGSGFR